MYKNKLNKRNYVKMKNKIYSGFLGIFIIFETMTPMVVPSAGGAGQEHPAGATVQQTPVATQQQKDPDTITINGKQYKKDPKTGEYQEVVATNTSTSQDTIIINGKPYKKDPKTGEYVEVTQQQQITVINGVQYINDPVRGWVPVQPNSNSHNPYNPYAPQRPTAGKIIKDLVVAKGIKKEIEKIKNHENNNSNNNNNSSGSGSNNQQNRLIGADKGSWSPNHITSQYAGTVNTAYSASQAKQWVTGANKIIFYSYRHDDTQQDVPTQSMISNALNSAEVKNDMKSKNMVAIVADTTIPDLQEIIKRAGFPDSRDKRDWHPGIFVIDPQVISNDASIQGTILLAGHDAVNLVKTPDQYTALLRQKIQAL